MIYNYSQVNQFQYRFCGDDLSCPDQFSSVDQFITESLDKQLSNKGNQNQQISNQHQYSFISEKKRQFQNVTNLVVLFMERIINNSFTIPIDVRFICHMIEKELMDRFGDEVDKECMQQVLCQYLFKNWILTGLFNTEIVGVLSRNNDVRKKNVKFVAKIIFKMMKNEFNPEYPEVAQLIRHYK